MSSAVEIKPAPDGDGFCLHFGDSPPVWFAQEHHAINYAHDVYPGRPIVVYEGEGIIKRRYEPRPPA